MVEHFLNKPIRSYQQLFEYLVPVLVECGYSTLLVLTPIRQKRDELARTTGKQHETIFVSI